MHPGRRVAATGQMAEKSKINPRNKIVDVIVWDTETAEQIARLSGFHVGAIICLSFNVGGDKLLTVGQDPNHSIAMYEWVTKSLLWSAKTSRGKLQSVAWKNDN
jgi:hypothetical protein